MKISMEEVEHIAELSRLILTDEEKEMFARSLGDILEYAAKISELDTEKVEPTAHVLPIKNVFREDEVRPSMDRELILKNAPDAQDGCFRVPKIVE